MLINNHGWGLREMIIYSSIILIALFLIVCFSSKLMTDVFVGDDSSSRSFIYSSLENSIRMATFEYMKKNYREEMGVGTITVTTANLVQYSFLKPKDFVMKNKDRCYGYALVKKNIDESLIVEPYIQCDSYETINYQSWRLGGQYE